jgi:hypothetical protein
MTTILNYDKISMKVSKLLDEFKNIDMNLKENNIEDKKVLKKIIYKIEIEINKLNLYCNTINKNTDEEYNTDDLLEDIKELNKNFK